MAKFDKTYCSSCGGEFGPGDEGYSHCQDHEEMKLSKSELSLLEWLAGPGLARKSECPRRELSVLQAKGLVWTAPDSAWVHMTEIGRKTLTELMALSADQD